MFRRVFSCLLHLQGEFDALAPVTGGFNMFFSHISLFWLFGVHGLSIFTILTNITMPKCLFLPQAPLLCWVVQSLLPVALKFGFSEHLKFKVKFSEVLPPWLPLFQQKRCLPVAIWPFIWSGPLSEL